MYNCCRAQIREILIKPNLEAYTCTQDTNGHPLNHSPLPIMRVRRGQHEHLGMRNELYQHTKER
ncbi:hypothetical protein VP01_6014g2, partial [Puccinia sorghi]